MIFHHGMTPETDFTTCSCGIWKNGMFLISVLLFVYQPTLSWSLEHLCKVKVLLSKHPASHYGAQVQAAFEGWE